MVGEGVVGGVRIRSKGRRRTAEKGFRAEDCESGSGVRSKSLGDLKRSDRGVRVKFGLELVNARSEDIAVGVERV